VDATEIVVHEPDSRGRRMILNQTDPLPQRGWTVKPETDNEGSMKQKAPLLRRADLKLGGNDNRRVAIQHVGVRQEGARRSGVGEDRIARRIARQFQV